MATLKPENADVPVASDAEPLDLVVVLLDEQRYALPVEAVDEVVRMVEVTPLPGAPPIVEGVIDVRGELVATIDVRHRLGLPARRHSPDQYLVLAHTPTRRVALRVDHALDLERVSADAPAPPEEVTRSDGLPIAGIVTMSDGLVLIQDLEAFLTQAEEAALDQALSESEPADDS